MKIVNVSENEITVTLEGTEALRVVDALAAYRRMFKTDTDTRREYRRELKSLVDALEGALAEKREHHRDTLRMVADILDWGAQKIIELGDAADDANAVKERGLDVAQAAVCLRMEAANA